MQAATYVAAAILLVSCIETSLGQQNKNNKRWAIRGRLLFLGAMQDDCLKDGSECPNGFGMELWINTANSVGYLVSNGGQSSKTNGFYVRKPVLGEYEVGVAMATNLWRQFVYLKTNKTVHLGFVWDKTNGLKLYVDGLAAGQQRVSESREYSNIGVDATDSVNYLIANGDSSRFQDLFDEDNQPRPGFEMGEVLNMTYHYTNQESVIREITKDIDDRLLVGCYSSIPNIYARSPVNMPAASAGANASYAYFLCRNGCAGSSSSGATIWVPKAAIVDPRTGACFCSPNPASAPVVACQESSIRGLWTSVALSDPYWNPVFSFQIANPKPIWRVFDEITFIITGITDDVTYRFDFGDGSIQVPTKESSATYAYKRPGKFVVKITMEYGHRAFSNESLMTLTIIPNHISKPPADFEIVSAVLQPGNGSMAVRIAASGEDNFRCRFFINPSGSGERIRERGGADPSLYEYVAPQELTRIERDLIVSALIPGVYDLVAACTNQYGNMTKARQLVVPYGEAQNAVLARNLETFDLAASNFAQLTSPATAVVRGSRRALTVSVNNATTIKLSQLDDVLEVGNNTVDVNVGGRLFCTVNIFVFRPVGESRVILNPAFTPQPKGYVLNFSVRIEAGDRIAGTVDFGDASPKVQIPVFAQACPCVYNGSYVYNQNGNYIITAALSSQYGGEPSTVRSESFRVDQPAIGEARLDMTPKDGRIYAGDTVSFELTVSTGFSLGGVIDFADGRTEAFRFDQLVCPCTRRFTRKYGVPNTENTVSVSLRGNYSDATKQVQSTVVVLTVPVGDAKLEIVDPPNTRYLPGDAVTIKLTVASGENVAGSINYGDGTPSVPITFPNAVCPCARTLRRNFTGVNNYTISANVTNIAGTARVPPIVVLFTQQPVTDAYLRPAVGSVQHMVLGDDFSLEFGSNDGEQVSVSIDFGDGSAVFRQDLFNIARRRCPCTGTVEKRIFATPGFYTITATFSNRVSSKSIQYFVSVNYRITQVSVEASTNRVIRTNADPVVFSVSVQADGNLNNQTGPVFVECQLENGKTTEFLPNFNPSVDKVVFSHSFMRYDAFPIVCTARNNISSVDTDNSLTVRVGIPMARMYVYSQRTRVAINEAIPFTVILQQGTGAFFDVSFMLQEGGIQSNVLSMTIEQDVANSPDITTLRNVSLTSPGVYEISVTARNAYGRLTAKTCQSVQVIDPATQKQSFEGEEACLGLESSLPTEKPEMFQSFGGSLTFPTETDCRRPIVVTAQFFRYSSLDEENAILIPVAQQLCSVTQLQDFTSNSTSVYLPVPPSRLGAGRYIAKVEITLEAYRQPIISVFDTTFEVLASPIQAGFTSEEEVLMENQPLILDFSPSGDPDVGLEDSENLRFDIFCSRKSKAPINMTFAEITEMSVNVTESLPYSTYVRDFNNSCDMASRQLDIDIGFRRVSFLTDGTFENNIQYYIFLFAQKTGRPLSGRAMIPIKVAPGNMSMDDALNRIEDLLAKGDKNAALTAINAVSQVLNKQSNDSSADDRTRVRERVVGILDNVSSSLDNFNQVMNTGNALKSVTQSRSEVTEDAKMRAGNALANVGNATKSFSAQPLHAITDVAGSIVNAVGNVLPTRAEQDSEKSLFEGKLPKINGSVVNASVFRTISTATPWLPSLSTVLPTSVMTAIVEAAHTGSPDAIKRVAREAVQGGLTTTPAALITSTVSMPQTITWQTVRYYASTMAPGYNETASEYNSTNTNDTAEVSELKDALAALSETDLPGRRTILRCIECGLPPEFSIEKEIKALSKENSFFTRREITLIEACALYRGLDLRCLFFYEDPSELRQLYRSCRAEEEAILAAKRKRDKALTKNTVGSIDAVSGVLLSKQETGGPGINLSNDLLSLKLVKVNASNSSDHAPHAMTSNTGGVSVPAGIVGNSSTNVSVGMQFLTTASNPFSYSDSAAQVKSGVVTLSYTNPDGTPMEVSNTSEPIDIRTASNPALVPPSINYTVFAPVADVQLLPINYHRIDLTQNDSSMHIVLKPLTDITQFQVLIGYRFFPNETRYNFSQMVPLHDTNDTMKMAKSPLAREELRYTVFPPTKLTKTNGSYYIGVKIIGAKIELPYVAHNYSYNMRIFTSGCRFWDEANETWSTRGCVVGPQTTIYETQCLCTHLTSFGTDFMVPPNAIDFNTVWSKFDAKNATVYSVMIVLICLYLILAVLAHRADKHDLTRWQPRPLMDNLPTDRYFYQVSIFTGWRNQAETQSRVRMIVVGAKGDTGVRCVQPARQTKPFVFRHGSINHFILSTEQPLGQLSYLRIWHDNSGKGRYKSWFLDQIQISDLQSERKYYFVVDRWLAIDHDDGAVERVVPVASLADLITFKYLFTSDIRRRFSEEHIWMSCVSRPTRSIFTRVQRITVCLSMLFTTMLANAMFYQNEEAPPQSEFGDDDGAHGAAARNTVRLGPISISMRELWISVVSSLIVVPVHAIAIYIFKNREPSKSTARVGQEGVSTVTKASPRWKPVDDKVLADFDNAEAIRNRRQGLRGFFDRAGKRIGGFFGKTDHENNYETEESRQNRKIFKKKNKKKFLLPANAVYAAYFMLGLAIVVSIFFLLLYSMSWGIEKSNRWSTAFFLSFFTESIVMEPVKIVAVVIVLSCIFKKPKKDKHEHHQIDATKAEVERWVVENKGRLTREEFDEISRRRHTKPVDLMPPDRDSLAEARKRRLHELEMENVVRDVVVYFVFVIIAMLLAFTLRGHASYTMHTEINNLMSPNFTSITTPQSYWDWINNVALPALYPDTDWAGKCLGWRDAQQISDFANLRIGVPRLRQFRVKENSCWLNKKLGRATNGERCLSDYDWSSDDTGPYLPNWKSLTPDNVRMFGADPDNLTDFSNVPLLRNSPWIYQDGLKLKGVSYSANMFTYKAGGYVAEFKRTKRETMRVLKHLQDRHWIDEKTRAVFFEFSTYNPNANLFTSPIIVMEFMASGDTVPRMDIKVFTVYDEVSGFQLVIWALGAIFIIYVGVYARIEYKRFKAAGLKGYFQEYFNAITLLMLIFSAISIVMYFVRMVMARVAAGALVGAGSEVFVNYGALATNGEIFMVFVGFASFFATLNFLKILNFNRRLAMLGMVLSVAMKDLKPFGIVFIGVFFAFAQLYYFAMGSVLGEYRSIVQTVETLMSASLGNFDFVSMRLASPVVGPLGFILFLIVVMLTLMGMFAVIMETAAGIRKQLREEHSQSLDYETMVYLWNKLKAMLGFYDDDNDDDD